MQFTYEAANCRIFYTPQTFYNYIALWKYAADAIWSNPALCVKNSTGYAVNGSDTTGPSTEVPRPSVVATPEVKLGSVIMSILDSPSADDTTLHDNLGSTNKKQIHGSFCNDTLPYLLTSHYYCDSSFQSCVKGKKNVGPACVYTCGTVGDSCGNNNNCTASKSSKKTESAISAQKWLLSSAPGCVPGLWGKAGKIQAG